MSDTPRTLEDLLLDFDVACRAQERDPGGYKLEELRDAREAIVSFFSDERTQRMEWQAKAGQALGVAHEARSYAVSQHAAIQSAMVWLEAVRDELEDNSDTKDGPEGEPRPNIFMRLHGDQELAMGFLRAALAKNPNPAPDELCNGDSSKGHGAEPPEAGAGAGCVHEIAREAPVCDSCFNAARDPGAQDGDECVRWGCSGTLRAQSGTKSDTGGAGHADNARGMGGTPASGSAKPPGSEAQDERERHERIRANMLAAEAWPEGTTADEKRLRRLLAARVGITYGDDGELQSSEPAPAIDFKRDPVQAIERKLAERGMAKLANEFQVRTEPTAADYAIEHAGYLATAADKFLETCNALDEAREKHEEAEPGHEAAAAYDVMFAAQERRGDAWAALRTAIYEFEKRRDRATRTVAGKES